MHDRRRVRDPGGGYVCAFVGLLALACGPSGLGSGEGATSGDDTGDATGNESTGALPCDGLVPCPDDSCPADGGEFSCCGAGGACPECRDIAEPCVVDDVCCPGLACADDVHQCRPCAGEGDTCGTATPCCAGTCTSACNGHCVTCLSLGDACTDDDSCCGAACIDETCAPCREAGEACGDHRDCCGGNLCVDEVCVGEPGPSCDVTPEPIDDGPSLRCESSCDTQLQDCPPGEECAAVDADKDGAIDATECRSDCGSQGVGEPCTRGLQLDDCGSGLFCLANDDSGIGAGRCHAYCQDQGGDFSCSGTGVCAKLYGGVAWLCLDVCDPINADQDCAGTSQKCLEHEPGEFGCTP